MPGRPTRTSPSRSSTASGSIRTATASAASLPMASSSSGSTSNATATGGDGRDPSWSPTTQRGLVQSPQPPLAGPGPRRAPPPSLHEQVPLPCGAYLGKLRGRTDRWACGTGGAAGGFQSPGTRQVSPDLGPWADAEPQARQAPHQPSQVRASGPAGNSLAQVADGWVWDQWDPGSRALSACSPFLIPYPWETVPQRAGASVYL